jgi:hypothetical protein
MTDPADLRAGLRARQHDVLAELLAGRTPAGFDPDGTALTTRVLHHKRSSAALRAAPELAELSNWRLRFHRFAAEHPQEGCTHDDVNAFAETVDDPEWRRLHEVYDGSKWATWVTIGGHRTLVVGVGHRVWRFRRRVRS